MEESVQDKLVDSAYRWADAAVPAWDEAVKAGTKTVEMLTAFVGCGIDNHRNLATLVTILRNKESRPGPRLIAAAQQVVRCWESGNLAEAVNVLGGVLYDLGAYPEI